MHFAFFPVPVVPNSYLSHLKTSAVQCLIIPRLQLYKALIWSVQEWEPHSHTHSNNGSSWFKSDVTLTLTFSHFFCSTFVVVVAFWKGVLTIILNTTLVHSQHLCLCNKVFALKSTLKLCWHRLPQQFWRFCVGQQRVPPWKTIPLPDGHEAAQKGKKKSTEGPLGVEKLVGLTPGREVASLSLALNRQGLLNWSQLNKSIHLAQKGCPCVSYSHTG